MRDIIESRINGYRKITGTSWPVEDLVTQDGDGYVVTFGACNGTALVSRRFRSIKSAMAYYNG